MVALCGRHFTTSGFQLLVSRDSFNGPAARGLRKSNGATHPISCASSFPSIMRNGTTPPRPSKLWNTAAIRANEDNLDGSKTRRRSAHIPEQARRYTHAAVTANISTRLAVVNRSRQTDERILKHPIASSRHFVVWTEHRTLMNSTGNRHATTVMLELV